MQPSFPDRAGTFRKPAACVRWRFGMRAVMALMLICQCCGCTWFRNLVGKCPEKAHRYAEQARLAEEAGNIPQAVAYWDQALDITPNEPRFHREIARLLLADHQPQSALSHLENAVEHNPDDVEANIELAELYIDNQQFVEATERLDMALQNDPRHPTALLLRAKLAEYQGDPETGLEIYHRVLSADPNHVEARLRIAMIQLAQQQPNLSAPLLRSVCQCSRATPEELAEARWILGIAYGQEQRWTDSVHALKSAAETRTGMSADDWYRLAYARSQLGDWPAVRQDLQQVFRLDPHHLQANALRESMLHQGAPPAAPILRIGHSVKPVPVPDYW